MLKTSELQASFFRQVTIWKRANPVLFSRPGISASGKNNLPSPAQNIKVSMSELYVILSIFVTGSLLLLAGLMFLFLVVPDSPQLGNYRRARYALAVVLRCRRNG
jgi:hypothetical protein